MSHETKSRRNTSRTGRSINLRAKYWHISAVNLADRTFEPPIVTISADMASSWGWMGKLSRRRVHTIFCKSGRRRRLVGSCQRCFPSCSLFNQYFVKLTYSRQIAYFMMATNLAGCPNPTEKRGEQHFWHGIPLPIVREWTLACYLSRSGYGDVLTREWREIIGAIYVGGEVIMGGITIASKQLRVLYD